MVILAAIVLIIVAATGGFGGSSDDNGDDDDTTTCMDGEESSTLSVCSSNTTPQATANQVCEDNEYVCPDDFFLCPRDMSPSCGATSTDTPSAFDNMICQSNNTWACVSGTCDMSSAKSCVGSDGVTPVASTCNADGNKWVCPDGSCESNVDVNCSDGTASCTDGQFQCSCNGQPLDTKDPAAQQCKDLGGTWTCSNGGWTCKCGRSGQALDNSDMNQCTTELNGSYYCDVSSGQWMCGCGNVADIRTYCDGDTAGKCSSSGSPSCPCASSDLSKTMCLTRNIRNDTLIIEDAKCIDGDIGCENAQAISCPIPAGANKNSPMPSCSSWSKTLRQPGFKQPVQGAFEDLSCPKWDASKGQWTCQDFFHWGSARPPVQFNSNVQRNFGGGDGKYGPSNTYYKGSFGVDPDVAGQIEPKKGSMSFCLNESFKGNGDKCSSKFPCLGGTLPNTDAGYFLRMPDQQKNRTTGYRVVSQAGQPYYYELTDHDGDSYCSGNYGLTQKDDIVKVIKNAPGTKDLTSCKNACTTDYPRTDGTGKVFLDSECFMYTWHDGSEDCFHFTTTAPPSDAAERVILNQDKNYQSSLS